MYDGISGAGGPSSLDPKQLERIQREQELQRTGKKQSPQVTPEQRRDSASISADAAEVARYQEMAQLHREAYGPEDRSEKLAQVKERVENGYYDRPDVIDEVVGRVLGGAVEPGETASRLDQVRQRSEEGFYDQPEVVERTAENIVQQVLPPRDEA